MKILWLCNTMLPAVAEQLGLEGSHKEGWVSGLAGTVLVKQGENKIQLSIAFPMGKRKDDGGSEYGIAEGRARAGEASFSYFGFPEDVKNAEKYDESLEPVLKKIVDKVRPDIVHCFGTEYAHTLAMCRIFPRKERLLVGLQGLCSLLAEAYYADLPEKVIRSVTLRDILRRDNIRQQKKKYALRGEMERESVRLAGNITGRTLWDRESAEKWNSKARYHHMNETLRKEFYGPVWEKEKCIPHSIFLSQGDYPLKGLHYMLQALPEILSVYPDARVYVAGNSLVGCDTLKQKLKISGYGRYLRRLLKENGIEDKVVFTGMLSAAGMRERCLSSSLFVCPSALENSPNSLGEAMLLGMPCVSARVGGIPSLFEGGEDGILYEGFRMPFHGEEYTENGGGKEEFWGRTEKTVIPNKAGGKPESGNGTAAEKRKSSEKGELRRVSSNLAEAVLEMWSDSAKEAEYCRNARAHALRTHDREQNYRRLIEIYEEIL